MLCIMKRKTAIKVLLHYKPNQRLQNKNSWAISIKLPRETRKLLLEQMKNWEKKYGNNKGQPLCITMRAKPCRVSHASFPHMLQVIHTQTASKTEDQTNQSLMQSSNAFGDTAATSQKVSACCSKKSSCAGLFLGVLIDQTMIKDPRTRA